MFNTLKLLETLGAIRIYILAGPAIDCFLLLLPHPSLQNFLQLFCEVGRFCFSSAFLLVTAVGGGRC